jgi:hypothetical protein
MPKPDHRPLLAWAWLHIHAALARTWKQGVQVPRVDWPIYPRRAEHNTVAEGRNRRGAETPSAKSTPRSGQYLAEIVRDGIGWGHPTRKATKGFLGRRVRPARPPG